MGERMRSYNNECICMMNGMERRLEKHLPERIRRWPPNVIEDPTEFEASPHSFPEPRTFFRLLIGICFRPWSFFLP